MYAFYILDFAMVFLTVVDIVEFGLSCGVWFVAGSAELGSAMDVPRSVAIVDSGFVVRVSAVVSIGFYFSMRVLS